MKEKRRDAFWLPSLVLFFIGVLDVIRGVLHTFLLNWSAAHIAKFDRTTPMDQLFLLGAFGISNYLTGFIYVLISRKARELSPYVLILVPSAYLLGLMGIWSGHVHAHAAFKGRYFMFVYFGICVLAFGIFLVQKAARQKPRSKS